MYSRSIWQCCLPGPAAHVDSSWNVTAHGDAWGGEEWRGNWRMEWVALHTIWEHGVSNITTADAHTSAASSRLNWLPRRFKWARPFRRKTKSGFCACAITFQLASTTRLRSFCEESHILEILSTRFNAHQYSNFALGFKVIMWYSTAYSYALTSKYYANCFGSRLSYKINHSPQRTINEMHTTSRSDIHVLLTIKRSDMLCPPTVC